MSSPPTFQRHLTFSLRTLFVVLTVSAVWLGVLLNRAREQQEIVRQIEAAGAAVHYDGPAYSEGMAAIGSQLPLWYHVFNKVKSVVLSTDIHPSNATQPDTKQALTEIIPALRRLTELGRVYVRTPVALSLSGLTAEEARIQYATRRLKAALPHCDVIVE